MLDGTGIVFDIVNEEWFPATNQRYIMWIQEIIPLIFTWGHIKLKYILMGYVFNVYALYYFCFLLTAYYLRDNILGIVYLVVHFLGDPYNYFIFFEELLPGACFAIAVVAIMSNPEKLSPFIRYLLLSLTAFFTVYAHPFASICFLLVLITKLFYNNSDSKLQHKYLITGVALIALFTLLKYSALNPYDNEMFFIRTKNVYTCFNELITADYIRQVLYYLFTTRTTFTICVIVCVVYFLVYQKYFHLAGFVLTIAGLIFILNMETNFADIKILDIPFHGFDRWSLPIRFWVFSVTGYILVPFVINTIRVQAFLISLVLLFFKNSLTIFEITETAVNNVRQAETIIEVADRSGVSKAVVMKDELYDPTWTHFGVFHDILIYSSLNRPNQSVQVVYAQDTNMLREVLQLPVEKIWLMDKIRILNLYQLNQSYFCIDVKPYQQIHLAAPKK